MKRMILLLIATCVVSAGAWAQLGIRNISSVQVDTYFGGELALDINQVLLFDVVDWLNGEVKIQRQDSERLQETTISVAPIFILSDYNYLIVRYGLGIGSGAEQATGSSRTAPTTLSHDLTVDANYETASMYANLAVRGSYYPDRQYWFVLPTAALRLPVLPGMDVLGRYFFSYNSEGITSHAALAELSYQLTERLRVKGGATGTIELREGAGGASGLPDINWELSGLAGISYRIRPALSLRYQLEYLGRIGATDGIRNVLTLDASF